MKYHDVSKPLSQMSGDYQFKEPPQILVSAQDFLAKILRNIIDFLRQFKIDLPDVADTKSVGDIMQVLIICTMVIVILLVLFTLYKRLNDLQRQAQIAKVGLATGLEILDSKAWKMKAKEHAESLDWREACRAVYMSSLYLMDENGILKFVATRTNYEYYYALSSFKKLRQPFRDLVNIVEGIWFGNDTATKTEYENCVEDLTKIENEIALKLKEKGSDV